MVQGEGVNDLIHAKEHTCSCEDRVSILFYIKDVRAIAGGSK